MRTKIAQKRAFGFALLQVTYWGFYAALLCYITSFFLEMGHTSGEVSTLAAGFMLMGFLGAFFWGEISDKLHTNRKTFLMETGISISLCVLIFALGKNHTATAVLYPLLGFFVVPVGGNMDAWLLGILKDNPGRYGLIRCFGSLSYAPVALLFGQLVQIFGFKAGMAGGLLFMAAAMTTAFCLPDDERSPGPETGSFSIHDVKNLFASRDYTLMIVTVLLTGMAIQPVNSLKIIILQNVHGDVGMLGMDAFIGVMIQVPFIAMAGIMRKIPLKMRVLYAVSAHMIMLVITSMARTPWMVICGSCFTNIGFGLILPSMRETVERYVPARCRNIGHNVIDAAYGSLAGVIALPMAGRISDSFGIERMVVCCVSLIMIPAMICILRLTGSRVHVHHAA